ncbi:MAG TPA: valine--tRNA ligase [Fimbriimonadaceae bacterium]|nr:valine--tRNA ligase [Fimbriimonadaceae bacterium]
MDTRYDASHVEANWYKRWSEAGLFRPDPDPRKPRYCITIPPPNITGSLHMGHALCYGLQDLLGRYKRMQGYSVLILPGQDHAGIATQSVVTKQLKKEGVSAFELGREKFVERVWEWREESGDTILRQLRSFGCAFDWDRTRFTLDDRYVRAVLKVFIDWFDRGLIYRGLRVVNWDPVLKTSVSDIETERRIVKGKFYHIRYPFKDGSGDIVIATTRPETMLADVAVAVHPKDRRYEGLVGKTLLLPLLGREIPLIADEYPDPDFGTGAVKITPGHDANDFEVGQRHGLEVLLALDETAKVTELGGPYAGLDRNAARKKVVEDLEAQGFLLKVENHEIPLVVSTRSNEPVEPMASEQWFVSQTQLAQKAIEAVKSGKTRFVPERYKAVYLDWMENIRDWCVSRQLWWGHRIPVYYTEDGEAFAALDWEDAQRKAGDKQIVRQEEDVLDTWFSSGLWPFATLGWPEQTGDLQNYYPTDVLVTARDIIYLWVARMLMMGLDFVGEIPFRDVYIYATVLTEDGKRMSKSLGTGVDPMEIIENKGADALRYTLFSQTGTNQELRYSDRRTDDARNLCNKMWNASRFVFMNLEGFTGATPESLHDVDKWILSRLARTEQAVRQSYEAYDIQSATQALYSFFWAELCDWYIEISKDRLADESQRATPQWILVTCLDAFLRMMHPVMPHITEEIFAQLPLDDKPEFLMTAKWPASPGTIDEDAERRVESWLETTRALRALRAELGIAAMKSVPHAYYEGDLGEGASIVASQAWVDELVQGRPEGKFISMACPGIELHLPTSGLIDEASEVERIDGLIAKASEELKKVESRLANKNFVERAKPEIVAKERQTAEEQRDVLAKLQARRKLFADQ